MTPDVRPAAATLLIARLPKAQWAEVRTALDQQDNLALHRLAFEAKVARRAARQAAAQPLGGKGSPGALITIGVISTLVLGLSAVALGGGLLLVPALIPAATVALVLIARWRSGRRKPPRPTADIGVPAPPDVRVALEILVDDRS